MLPALSALALGTDVRAKRRRADNEEPPCSICLDTLKNNDSVLFPCGNGHRFHIMCLAQWVYKTCTDSSRATCPFCRGPREGVSNCRTTPIKELKLLVEIERGDVYLLRIDATIAWPPFFSEWGFRRFKQNSSVVDLTVEQSGFFEPSHLRFFVGLKTLQVVDMPAWTSIEGMREVAAQLLRKEDTQDKLNRLYFERSLISAEALKQLELYLANSKVKALSMTETSISDEAVGVLCPLIDDKTAKSHIRNINLRNNRISAHGCKLFASALSNGMCSLVTLNLDGNKIGEEGAFAISAALRDNISLKQLSIESNFIETSGAIAIMQALLQNNTLMHLNLDENNIDNMAADSITNALKQNSALKTLSLARNSFEQGTGLVSIGLALSQNSSLESLDFSFNTFGAEGTESLASGFDWSFAGANKALQGIDLSGTYMGDAGSVAIADKFLSNEYCNVSNLTVHTNGIGPNGAMALFLPNSTKLAYLDLSINEVGDSGAKEIAGILEKNNVRALEILILDNNDIGDIGATALAKVLKNRVFKKLSLDDNVIGDKGARQLALVLSEARQLALVLSEATSAGTSLSLQGNLMITENGFYAIEQARSLGAQISFALTSLPTNSLA